VPGHIVFEQAHISWRAWFASIGRIGRQ
jgi:hypothetical protein